MTQPLKLALFIIVTSFGAEGLFVLFFTFATKIYLISSMSLRPYTMDIEAPTEVEKKVFFLQEKFMVVLVYDYTSKSPTWNIC